MMLSGADCDLRFYDSMDVPRNAIDYMWNGLVASICRAWALERGWSNMVGMSRP